MLEGQPVLFFLVVFAPSIRCGVALSEATGWVRKRYYILTFKVGNNKT
jgi:hypothetical protein